MQKNDQEYLAYLRAQMFKDIDERSINGIYVYFAAWLLIAGVSGFYKEQATIFWSTGIIFFALGIIRLRVHLYYSKSQNSNQTTRKKWMFFNVLAPACIYSILFSSSMLLASFEPLFTYLLMVIFALVSTGAVIFAPMKKLSLAFLGMLTPLPFVCAAFISEHRLVEGLMLLLYSSYMFAQAIQLNKEYLLNLKQRFKLDKLNQQDSLTGIANRRRFDSAFESAWKSALRSKVTLCLILIDIDFFKKVNDQYGHSAGDSVIKNIAKVIKATCQRETDVVARIGGEEYAVLLKNYDIEKLANFAERIRQSVESTITQSDKHEIKVTVSLGTAYSTAELSKSTNDLFKAADKNLYSAKEQGRNKVVITEY